MTMVLCQFNLMIFAIQKQNTRNIKSGQGPHNTKSVESQGSPLYRGVLRGIIYMMSGPIQNWVNENTRWAICCCDRPMFTMFLTLPGTLNKKVLNIKDP